MGREWKRGDVAMLTTKCCGDLVASKNAADGWHVAGAVRLMTLCDIESVRPLVVIDPTEITGPDETAGADPMVEIAACLRRLAERDSWSSYRRRVAERLAEVFDPALPKPDEPTGLGAVVATESDGDWIRVSAELANPWLNVQTGSQRHWDRVPAVRVLSEGVTS